MSIKPDKVDLGEKENSDVLLADALKKERINKIEARILSGHEATIKQIKSWIQTKEKIDPKSK